MTSKNSSNSVNKRVIRARKCVQPDWQQKLVTFYKINNKETMVKSKRGGKSSSTDKSSSIDKSRKSKKPLVITIVDQLPQLCGSEEIFLLCATICVNMNSIEPAIIMVEKDAYEDATSNDSSYIKYKFNEINYAAKILASSVSRPQLVKAYDNIMKAMPNLFNDQDSGKKPISYSCTSIVQIEKAKQDEILCIALNHLMKSIGAGPNNMHTNEQDLSQIPELPPDRILLATSSDTHEQDFLPDEPSDFMNFVSTPNSSKEISKPNFDETSISEITNDQEKQQETAVEPISGNSQPSTDTQDQVIKKNKDEEKIQKRKKRSSVKKYFCDQKLLAKVKIASIEKKDELDSLINNSLEFLSQTLPTLKPTKPYHPILSHMHQLLKAINEKIEQQETLKSMNSGYDIENSIKIKRSKDKKITIGDRLTVPCSSYGFAIDGKSPNLVVSRFMRKCIEKATKLGAGMNNKLNDTNFVYRLGNSELQDEERLQDGQQIIDMIIEHAHQVLGLKHVTYKEYRECITQINKALYDVNRAEGDKNSKRTRKHAFDEDETESDSQSEKRSKKLHDSGHDSRNSHDQEDDEESDTCGVKMHI